MTWKSYASTGDVKPLSMMKTLCWDFSDPMNSSLLFNMKHGVMKTPKSVLNLAILANSLLQERIWFGTDSITFALPYKIKLVAVCSQRTKAFAQSLYTVYIGVLYGKIGYILYQPSLLCLMSHIGIKGHQSDLGFLIDIKGTIAGFSQNFQL